MCLEFGANDFFSVAALKCRQRKKQWLANLQTKVELYSTENDALNAQVGQLRQEVMNLKTLLLAHKDCPVTQSQGLTAMNMGPIGADFSQHPYNLAMTGRPPVMAGQNGQRRYS
jgi:ATF/CREB family transcription factor